MTICTKCVLGDKIPGIEFDSNGVCSYCGSVHEFTEKGKGALIKITDSIRNKHSMYDAIVPVSGGRDSTYVLYYAVRELGLRVLAVNYDNEFTSEQAKENMRNAVRILNVDFITVRSRFNLASLLTKYKIRANAKAGHYGVINTMCTACGYGQKAAVYRTAVKQNIPLILWGGSDAESTIDHLEKAASEYRIRYKKHFTSWKNKMFNIDHHISKFIELLLHMELHVEGNSIFSKKPQLKRDDIIQVSLYDYIKWDRNTIKETIMGKLEWKRAEGHISTWRNDCRIHPLMNYSFLKLYANTKDAFGYSNMINNGNMDRETALIQEKHIAEHAEESAQYILEKIIKAGKKAAESLIK